MELEVDNINLADELLTFRQQWHEELLVLQENKEDQTSKNLSVEEKAAQFFKQGAQFEADGNINAALYFYRQAVRLVPDIEFSSRLVPDIEFKIKYDERDQIDTEQEVKIGFSDNSTEINTLETLTISLQYLNVKGSCIAEVPQKGLHISALPTELLNVIICWIVSLDLDIKSLERLSLVCKWFYTCARDEDLWKTICKKIWGTSCKVTHLYSNSWRLMYYQRPHIQYNGLYISVNTYIRTGEQTLNSSYKPCHLVQYCKYLRFFTDGTVLVYASADDPKLVVEVMHSPPYRDRTVYKGHYRLVGTNFIHVYYMRSSAVFDGKRKRNTVLETQEQHFFMRLILENTKKQKNNKLSWENYSYQVKNKKSGQVNEGKVDTVFRPYIFNPVRSYCAYSSASL
ncbi:F-box only protein 9 isoform X1 [Hydra vulgaris]|uniref:F-box only protein 9 isoform X1 n=1 Tax=Hydra vulgaris TaxID=6087 RepID=UPI001F5EC4B0|nr:F-box only protein 9 isoform X2 [Hydra vulgaris]